MISRFLKNVHYRKYFFNTGWLLAEKVIRIFSNALVGIVVARYLGPDNYGLLNYAASYIAVFMPIAALGLGDIIVREFIRNPERESEILGTALYLRFFSSGILISVIFLTLLFTHDEPITKVLIMITAGTLIFQSFDILDRFFQAKVKAKTTVKAYIISLLVSSVLKIVAVSCKAPLEYFALIQTVEVISLSIAWVYYFKASNQSFASMSFSSKLAFKFIRESGVIILSNLMVILYMRIDQFMIKKMLDNESLGNFTAAVKLSESYYFIPGIIVNSLFPAILYGKTLSEKEYRSRVQRLYNLLTWISIPLAISVSVIADPLTVFLYGNKYTHVGAVLSLHIWAGVFAFWGSASVKWFVIEKIPILITISTILGCTANIVLNLYMIPHYNIMGAAISTLIAQLIAVVLSLLIFSRTRVLFLIILNSLNPFNIVKSFRQ